MIQTIRLPNDFDLTSIAWRKASECIRVLAGRVVVEMFPEPLISGQLVLPDRVKKQLRPHLGVVLQSQGASRVKGRQCLLPAPGSIVMVNPDHGTWLEKADMGEYKPSADVRVYGVYGEFIGHPQSCDWWESVLGGYDDDMKMRPYGDRIFLRRDEAAGKTDTGIYLPDGHHVRSALATVEAVGPFVFDLKPGDRVCYDPYHVEQVGVTVGSRTDFELIVCTQLSVNYVLGAA